MSQKDDDFTLQQRTKKQKPESLFSVALNLEMRELQSLKTDRSRRRVGQLFVYTVNFAETLTGTNFTTKLLSPQRQGWVSLITELLNLHTTGF